MQAQLAGTHFHPIAGGSAPVEATPAVAGSSLAFGLFILLNGVLFIRPAEILPSLEGLPIYNVVIVACILTSLPVLLRQLSWSNLRAHPAVFCVVGLLPVIVLSQLVRGNTWHARQGAIEFGKVVIFFLLLTGLVNTPARLSRFIVAVVLFIVGIAAIAALNYRGVIHVAGITTADRRTGFDESGQAVTVEQLYGPGIFNDPNDFSLILSTGMLILIHFALDTKNWSRRLVVLAACAVPAYAFAMTRSRGGFLALGAGLMVLAVSRFGWKRSIPLMVLGLPVMLVLFGGRMTNINLGDEDDTAQGRMMLWREGFVLLRGSPVFGIGYGAYAEEVGHVAHNSFVHSFVELSLMGGIAFTAAFYVPLSVLRRSQTQGSGLDRWRPALLAILVDYSIGLCSLSRTYTVSTYLIIGLGAAYCTILSAHDPKRVPVMTGTYFKRLIVVGVACLLFFNLFVRIF